MGVTFWGCLHCGMVSSHHSALVLYCPCTGRGVPMIKLSGNEETVDCGGFYLRVVPSWG